MPIELKIPEVGESITEVQIAQWLKAEGDAVQKDEPVAVIDSEKTTFELPAPESGTLSKIVHEAGATVNVGEVIGQMEAGADRTAGTRAKSESRPPARSRPRPRTSEAAEPEGEPRSTSTSEAAAEFQPGPTGRSSSEKIGTEAKPGKTAKDSARPPKEENAEVGDEDERENERESTHGNEASTESRPRNRPRPRTETQPPAKGERPVEDEDENEDEKKATAKSTPRDGEEEIVPMSMLRRTVARRLVEAKQQMAMLTTFNELDMSAVQALRHEHQEAFEKRHKVKLGLMSFFVKAAVDALKQFPQLNAEVRGNDIVYRNYFNIGVAIATGRGLVVPALRRAESLGFADIEKAIGDFAARAKDGKLKPEELEGATFTITNGGVFGSLLSTPIINPPQSGILGMHTIQERPIAVAGQVVIRPMMYLALTYDHRIVDGREAVLFLRRIKEAIESPARMLLEV